MKAYLKNTQKSFTQQIHDGLRPRKGLVDNQRLLVGKTAGTKMPQAGRFGERVIANLVGGDIVSTEPEFSRWTDVFVPKVGFGFQSTTANGRHQARLRLNQVRTTHDQTKGMAFDPFGIKGLFYACVFYRGISSRPGIDGRSLMTSKVPAKNEMVIGETLQYIYLFEVKLVWHLAFKEQQWFSNRSKNGKSRLRSDGKDHESSHVLWLNREFIRPFTQGKDMPPHYMEALDDGLGKSQWSVRGVNFPMKFKLGDFQVEKRVPIWMIGSKKKVSSLSRWLGDRPPVDMTLG